VFFFIVKLRVRKKSWNKNKYREFICGYCDWCKKELLNTMGGWIITHTKKYFCHDGKDGSCFDKYCNFKKETNEKRLSQNKVW
jgi:hypothetical protein